MCDFKLKKPCANCPFRNDLPPELKGWLGRERAENIARSVLQEDKTFQCHKTFGNPHGGSMCAGALAMLKKAGKEESSFGNQAVQIAERFKMYNPNDIPDDAPVFGSIKEMGDFHACD